MIWIILVAIICAALGTWWWLFGGESEPSPPGPPDPADTDPDDPTIGTG